MSVKVSIYYFFLELMMIFISLYYYKRVSNINIKCNYKNIIFIIIICLALIFNNLYNIHSLRFLTSIILNILIAKIIFKLSIKDSIYFTFIYSFLSILLELLLTPLLLVCFKNVDLLNDNYRVKILFSVVHSLIMYMLIKKQSIIDLIIKIRNFFKLNNLLLLFLIMINIIILYRGLVLDNYYIYSLSIISVIFIIITVKVIINDRYNISLLINRNNHLKNSYKAYADTIDQCREFKHNIKNELYGLKGNLPADTQKIINDIIVKYNNDYEWINKIGEVPEGLQGILFLKQEEAKQNKIDIMINTSKKIETNKEDYLDLCDTVGILLDNAIYATKESKHKIIDINITEKKEYINIEIKNLFINNMDINKLGKKNYSTKPIKSGIGLNYIKNLKNSKIKVYFKIVNDLFITNISYRY